MASRKSLNINMSRIAYLHNNSKEKNVAVNEKVLNTIEIISLRNEKKVCVQKNIRKTGFNLQVPKCRKEGKSCAEYCQY